MWNEQQDDRAARPGDFDLDYRRGAVLRVPLMLPCPCYRDPKLIARGLYCAACTEAQR